MTKNPTTEISERPPVVAVLGHVDHGKSSLLDYIRKTNVVAGEAGGITQYISAYEVTHKNDAGTEKKITFLDTPGHAAFSGMRERGVEIADIAILVVSAEDGAKAQTVEAYKTIKQSGIPFIVAINKIDKPAADIERTKQSLAENEVYVEGYGGSVSAMPISAKSGAGIPELLDMILLAAELEGLKGDAGLPGTGFVLESFLDPKRGISTTLVIKDGTVGRGAFILAGSALAPFRIVEDFMGKPLESASFSKPIKVTGWDGLPETGSRFLTYTDKKQAEEAQKSAKEKIKDIKSESFTQDDGSMAIVPLIIKADVVGTLEAVLKEIQKIKKENTVIKIVSASVGAIGENDVLLASGDKRALVVGFNVKVETKAKDQAERLNIPINTFDIIYKLSEWLETVAEERRPREEVKEIKGMLKILKTFSAVKDKQVIGGRVLSGSIVNGGNVRILRRDFEIGQGKIMELQCQKVKTGEVPEGNECGLQVESKMEIAPGDVLEEFVITKK